MKSVVYHDISDVSAEAVFAAYTCVLLLITVGLMNGLIFAYYILQRDRQDSHNEYKA